MAQVEFEDGRVWRCTSCGHETALKLVFEADSNDPCDPYDVDDIISDGLPAFYDPGRDIALCDACFGECNSDDLRA